MQTEMLSRYLALKFCPCSMARFRSSRIPVRKERNCAPAGVRRVLTAGEPTAMIQSGIIARQDKLIQALYHEETADEEAKALMAEIRAEKARLETRPLAQHLANRAGEVEKNLHS